MIFGLDDDGMKYTYYEKGRETYDYSVEMHVMLLFYGFKKLIADGLHSAD